MIEAVAAAAAAAAAATSSIELAEPTWSQMSHTEADIQG